MLSGGLDADPGMIQGELLVRGARAHPDSQIGTFKNVGGMKRDADVWPDFPFLRTAFEILDEDPVDYRKLEEPPVAKLQNSVKWSVHLRQLWHVLIGGFVVDVDPRCPTDQQREHYEKELGICSRICAKYTSVWKDVDGPTPIARVIFDLRRLNAVCTEKNVPFTILGAPQMIKEMRDVPTERGMFTIVHADLVNFYYQIGVGADLGRRMVLLWGDKYVQSLVLCMGFSKACGVAMAICMALLLRHEEGDVDLGIPTELHSSDSAPGCVRLKNGGVIFLVYDSIMIICPKKDAMPWYHKLQSNFGRAGLQFKYCKVAAPGEIVNYCGMEARSDREGIKWRVAATSLSTWKILRRATLRRSPRTLFKVTGYLRFALAVTGEPRWRLGRVSKAQSRLGKVTEWDDLVVTEEELNLAWGLFDELVAEWDTKQGWKHRRSHVPVATGSLFVVVAVDATELTWAVNVLTNEGVVDNLSEQGVFRHKRPIAEAEAFGGVKGLQVAQSQPAPVVILCNDNRGIGRGFWKGYSPKDPIDELVKKGLECMKGKAYVGVDIPTDENYADIGTRTRKVYSSAEVSFRRRRTFERAMLAAEEWRKSGTDYFGREAFEFGCEDEENGVAPPEYISSDECDI